MAEFPTNYIAKRKKGSTHDAFEAATESMWHNREKKARVNLAKGQSPVQALGPFKRTKKEKKVLVKV